MGALAPSAGPAVLVRRGREVRGGAAVTWSHTISVDTSAQQLALRVAVRLAQHYRDSLLRGVRHDTGAATPRDRDGTPLAVRTGWMARNWRIGPARGSDRQSGVVVEPNLDHEREAASPRWGVLQSTAGNAGAVMRAALAEATGRVFSSSRRLPASGGVLPALEAQL